ncbi:MAG: FkbM family methyltransferase [Vicinamibacterales bacterium]
MTPRIWIGETLRWYLKHARHPFKDYLTGRYWSWFARPRLWVRYDDDATIGVRLGDYLQQRIFFDGYYERPLIEWLKRTLRPDDVFWDVGANVGAITLVAARLCRHVVAFEPDPRSVEALTSNIRINRLKNVEVQAVALGAEGGRAVLHQTGPANTGRTSLIGERGDVVGQTEVTVVRADDVIAAHPELAPTIMKIDVEGAEHLVIRGAAELLRGQRVRAIVFEDRRDDKAGPSNAELLASLGEGHYRVEPFNVSDAHLDDGMYNFLATPSPRS